MKPLPAPPAVPAEFSVSLPSLFSLIHRSGFVFALGFTVTAMFSDGHAQTAADPNEGLRLTPAPTMDSGYEITWWGRAGHTYFIEHNPTLVGAWTYFPDVLTGQDAVLGYGFTSTAPRVFVRLRIVEGVWTDPYTADSDGDGLTNQQEFVLGTDPLNPDSDADDIPDGWEVEHGLDPMNPADALIDPDGDGRSSAQEFLEGTHPLVADVSPSTGSAPPPPGQLAVQKLPAGAWRLTWTGSPAMLGYLVERSSNFATWDLIGFTVGSTPTYDDTHAIPGVAYAYRVKGVY